MSQWDKLIESILGENPNLRFDDLRKALLKMEYTETVPQRREQPLHISQRRLYAYNHP